MARGLEQSAFFGPLFREFVRNSGKFRSFRQPRGRISPPFRLCGGEGGIRTPDTLSGMPVFKTGAINHSATSPNMSVPRLSAR